MLTRKTTSPSASILEPVIKPEFPVHIFPERIADMIMMLEEVAKFEKQITGSTLLFVVSTLIGNRQWIHVKETWLDTPNLWIAIVGKPGTMKTPSMSFMLAPLKKMESQYNEQFIEAIHIYNQIPKKEREEHSRPRRIQKYSNDPTVEGLIDAMQYNPDGMGIYKDELNGFFEEMNRYNSGGNKEFYMSAFSGGQYIKNRKSYDPVTIDNIFLSILGSIQPNLLRDLAQVNISNGMIDRWLYVESDNTIPTFNGSDIDREIIEMYDAFIREINSFFYQPLVWESQAKDQFFELTNAIGEVMQDDGTSEKLATYLSKMRTYFARFIPIICTMHGTNLINPVVVDFARELVNYFINTAKNTFIGFDAATEIEIIWQRENALTKQERVKSLLKNFPKMTKKEIAERCGVSRQLVYKFG